MVDVYRLRPAGLAPAGRIVRRAGMEAIADASGLMEAAEARAVEIEARAQAEREAERERGYAEGLEAARRDALAGLLAERAALDAALVRTEEALAALVLDCTRAIVAGIDPVDTATAMTRHALARMRRERRAQLLVPPGIADGVRARMDRVLADFPEVELVDVVEDASLEPPTVVLQSESGRVACSLGDALEDLSAIVRGAVSLAASTDVVPPAAVPSFDGAGR